MDIGGKRLLCMVQQGRGDQRSELEKGVGIDRRACSLREREDIVLRRNPKGAKMLPDFPIVFNPDFRLRL
jgi:hypothetical protein